MGTKRTPPQAGGRGGKNKNNGSQSKESEAKMDKLHSLSTPCCGLAERIGLEMFPEALERGEATDQSLSETEGQPCPFLSRIIRTHLIQQRQSKRQAISKNTTNSTGTKKKRKKKKKKKGKGTNALPADGDTTTSTETATTETITELCALPTPPNIDSTQMVDKHESEEEPVSEEIPLRTPIDKFLDYVIDKVDDDPLRIKNRELSSFIKFLSERFQQQLEQQDKKKSKRKKGTESSDHILPTILMKDINAACQSIHCRTCRTSAEVFLRSTCITRSTIDFVGGIEEEWKDRQTTECIVLQPVVNAKQSNLSVPVFGPKSICNDDTDPERAFDYLAMEEGYDEVNGGSSDKSFSISLFPVVDDDGRKQGFKMKAQKDDSNTMTYPLDVYDIEQLISCLVLPCGLVEREYEEHTDDYELSEIEFQSTCKYVDDNAVKIYRQIIRIQKLHDGNNQAFDKLRPKAGEAYDVKSTKFLMSCDSTCNEYFDEILSMLLSLTKVYHSMVSKGSETSWATDSVDTLWHQYDVTITTLLKGAQLHEGRIINLANRPGNVPQMFLDATHRSSFRKMLGDKLSAISSFVELFQETLLCTEGQGPDFVTKLYTYERFYTLLEKLSDKTDNTELDTFCSKLLHEYIQLTHTVHGSSVRSIIDTQKSRCEKLSTLLANLEKHTVIAYKKTEEDIRLRSSAAWNDLRKEYTCMHTEAHQGDFFDNELMSDDFQVSRMVSLRTTIGSLTRNVLTQWRFVRSLKGSCSITHPFRSPRLPVQLQNFLEKTEDGQDPKDSPNSTVCHGGGGKRRVESILASLLYQWLCDRSMDWHAELTQRELLEAMDSTFVLDEANRDVANSASGQPSKASKKKKKKKRASNLSTKDQASTQQRSDESVKFDDMPKDNPQSSHTNNIAGETEELVGELATTASISRSHEHTDIDIDTIVAENEYSELNENENSTIMSDNFDVGADTKANAIHETQARRGRCFSKESHEDPMKEDTCCIDQDIGVVDHQGVFESAESFLCRRLETILMDGGVVVL